MSVNLAVFAFVGGVGLAILGMTAYLVVNKMVDGAVFTTLAGGLMGGIIGLLAPSPTAKVSTPNGTAASPVVAGQP